MSKKIDKARYYPPEAMPFILCVACVGMVLEHSEKAMDLYDKVIECHDLPGCRKILDKLGGEIPKREGLLKLIVKESGYDYKKPPERENVGIPYMRGLLRGGLSLASKYRDKFLPWVLKNRSVNRDFIKLINRINDLIKIGFNNESDSANGKYKITASGSNLLANVICLKSLVEYCGLKLTEWEKYKVVKIGKRTYDMADVLNDEVTNRMHRYLVKNYKNSKFALKHDNKIEKVAWLWYQCRVAYSGPAEFCRSRDFISEETLDPNDIDKEIRDCDLAVGYPRGKPNE